MAHPKDIKIIIGNDLIKGEWKPIPDYEDCYSVNEYGVVMSKSREVPFTNRWGQRITRLVEDKILPWYISSKGYARVQLSKKHEKKMGIS